MKARNFANEKKKAPIKYGYFWLLQVVSTMLCWLIRPQYAFNPESDRWCTAESTGALYLVSDSHTLH